MQRFGFICLVFTSIFLETFSASATASTKPYYQDKIISITVMDRAGGGTDTMARIIASVIPKYIPGNPTIVVQNMPGGSGAVANNAFWKKGKPDGLHLLMNASGAVNLQSRGADVVKYNLLDYKIIGNVGRGGNVILVRKDALKRLYDSNADPVVCGTQEGAETWMSMLLWGKEFLGWNIRWIIGYTGTSDIEMALQRGEVDTVGTSNAFIINQLTDKGLAVPLCQSGIYKKNKFIPRPDLPDVPTFEKVLGTRKPAGMPWRAYLAAVAAKDVDKFLCAARGTPDKYISILRNAFAKTVRDPKFDAAVKKMVSNVYDYGVGEETAQLLRNALDAPKPALEYAVELQRKFGIISSKN